MLLAIYGLGAYTRTYTLANESITRNQAHTGLKIATIQFYRPWPPPDITLLMNLLTWCLLHFLHLGYFCLVYKCA